MLGRKKGRLTESNEAVVLCPAPFRNGRALFFGGCGVWVQETFREVDHGSGELGGPREQQFCDKVCWARHLTNSAEYPGWVWRKRWRLAGPVSSVVGVQLWTTMFVTEGMEVCLGGPTLAGSGGQSEVSL